jgi:hypothetical protein
MQVALQALAGRGADPQRAAARLNNTEVGILPEVDNPGVGNLAGGNIPVEDSPAEGILEEGNFVGGIPVVGNLVVDIAPVDTGLEVV